MGLLDDAIRDHLELKRRHGADPSEIERAEREALGPLRRAPDELEQEEFGEHAGGEYAEHGPTDTEYAEPSATGAEYADSLPGEHAAQFADEHTRPLAPVDWPENGDSDWDEEIPEESALHVESAYEAPPPHPAGGAVEPIEPASPPPAELEEPPSSDAEHTLEYQLPEEDEEAPEHHAPPPERGESDVLEETPEFLQDAPEHDRLWFEQRPPRDFDFDE
jgi:hypothetical protein